MKLRDHGIGHLQIHPSTMDPELVNMARSGDVDALHKRKRKELESTFLLQRTHKGNNTALHIACKFGHRDFAAEIISLCPELLLLQNSREDTALHNAARAGHADVVRKLIKCAEKQNKKEDMLGMMNMEGNTVLHEAATNRNGKVVKLLIKESPNLAFVTNTVSAAPPALYVAAEKGCVESVVHILSALKDSEDVHCQGPLKRTPLHAAVIRQHLGITKKLINERRDFIQQRDEFGNYPIHYAAAVGNLQMVHKLLRADTSAAYLENTKKQSPFYVAASNGHVNVMKELLRSFPNSCLSGDEDGCNALHVAAKRGNLEVVKYILDSEYLVELINEPNTTGNTPLHLAITNRQLSVSSFLIKDKRVDVNIKNKKDKTALDIVESNNAVTKKFEKIIMCKALIRAKGTRGLQQRNRENTRPRINSYKGMSRVISTVAALIITVSFAAAFTLPGGFNSDGKAVLEKKWILWLFIITDALALFASIIVELVLMPAAIGDVDLLIAAHSISIKLLAISLVSLALAFLFGLLSIVPIALAIIVFSVLVGLIGLVLYWVQRFSWFPLFYLSLIRSIKDKLSSIICSCSHHMSLYQHLSFVPVEHLHTHPPQSSALVENEPSSSPYHSAQVENQPTNPLQGSDSGTEIFPNTNEPESSIQVIIQPTNQPPCPTPMEIQGTNHPHSSSEFFHSNEPDVSSQVQINTTNSSQSPPIEIQYANLHINQPESSVSLVIRGADRSPIFDLFRAHAGTSLSSEILTALPNSQQNLNILVNLPVRSLIESLISAPNLFWRLLRRLKLQTSPQGLASREFPQTLPIEFGNELQSLILNSSTPSTGAFANSRHGPLRPFHHSDTSSNTSSNSGRNVPLDRTFSWSENTKTGYNDLFYICDNSSD